MENPVARQHSLVTLDVADETLVYDLQTNKAHCLNHSAAIIWKLCDGTNDIGAIARRFEADTHSGKVTDDFVWLALSQLDDNRLLDSVLPPRSTARSRRQLLKTIGYASAALPMIASLVVQSRSGSLSCDGCVNPGSCLNMVGCPSTTFCNSLGMCAPNPPRSTPKHLTT